MNGNTIVGFYLRLSDKIKGEKGWNSGSARFGIKLQKPVNPAIRLAFLFENRSENRPKAKNDKRSVRLSLQQDCACIYTVQWECLRFTVSRKYEKADRSKSASDNCNLYSGHQWTVNSPYFNSEIFYTYLWILNQLTSHFVLSIFFKHITSLLKLNVWW